jgi:hypothetical protein
VLPGTSCTNCVLDHTLCRDEQIEVRGGKY